MTFSHKIISSRCTQNMGCWLMGLKLSYFELDTIGTSLESLKERAIRFNILGLMERMKNTWQCILTKICVSHFPQKHIKKKINHIFRFCFLTHTFFLFFLLVFGERVSGFNMLGLMEDKDHVAALHLNEILYLSFPLRYTQKKLLFFFSLSLILGKG